MPQEATLLFGLELTVAGLLIVFAVLALIALGIAIIARADSNWQAREAAARKAQAEREPTIDSTTLVLIGAAVATVLAGRQGRIRRVHRIRDHRDNWGLAGRQNILGSHSLPKSGGH